MARIIGSVIGELRGKASGYVFSRNRGGAYVRQYVVPVNPRTGAQTLARAAFTNSASGYNSLSSAQRAAWDSFALNIYNPRRGSNNGQFSGANAFAACNTVLKSQENAIGTGLIASMVGSLTVASETVVSGVNYPAATTLSSQLLATSGAPIDVAITDTELKMGTGWNIDMDLLATGGVGTGSETLNDELKAHSGQRVGFVVYISNPVPTASTFVSNPYFQRLAASKLPTFTSTTGVPDIRYSGALDGTSWAGYKSAPAPGQWVLMSIGIYSEFGQFQLLGSRMTEVTT